MTALIINAIIFFLLILFLSAYRIYKHGIVGLNLTFFIIIIGIIAGVIESVLEGKTLPFKLWILIVTVFLLSIAMLILIQIKIRNEK